MRILPNLPVVALAFALGGVVTAADAQTLMFEGDMVRGRGRDYTTGPVCVLASQFKREEHVVWRVRVVDPQTGEELGDDALESVVIELPDGQTFEAGFGPHPRGRTDDFFWATSWKIPGDYPTGTLGYKVVATDTEGNIHEWEPFKIESSRLTVVPGDADISRQ